MFSVPLLFIPQIPLLLLSADMLIQQTTADPALPFWAALLINSGILATIVGVVGYILKRNFDTKFERARTDTAEATKESNMVTAIGQLATSLTESTRAFAIEMQKERATMIDVIKDNTDAKAKLAAEVNTTTLNLAALNANVDEMKADAKRIYDRLALLFPREEAIDGVIEKIITDAVKQACDEKHATGETPVVTLPQPETDIKPPAETDGKRDVA